MPYNIHHPHRAQAPLEAFLSLVDDLNTHPRRNRGGCSYAYRGPAAPRRPWQPRFDAQETPEAFVLRGELPGLNKDHVTIEFPEAQKIVISGKVVESAGEATSSHVEETQQPATTTSDDASSETESRSSYQATVEDADDDDDFEMLGQTSEKSQEKQKQPAEPEAEQKKTEEQEQPAQERVSRQFSRAFTFSVPISHDFVTATLKDGLLTVEVPKAKHEPHHVVVN